MAKQVGYDTRSSALLRVRLYKRYAERTKEYCDTVDWPICLASYSLTRVIYSPVRVSIWILSPSSTNGGTWST